MKKNMGATDRLVRILAAIAVVVLYYLHLVEGTFGIVLLVIAGVFVLTSLINFCPLYKLFNISSAKKDK